MERMLEMVWMAVMCQWKEFQRPGLCWILLTRVLCMRDSGTSGFKRSDSSAGEGAILDTRNGPGAFRMEGVLGTKDECVVPES